MNQSAPHDELDRLLAQLHQYVRVLPGLTARACHTQRAQLVAEFASGRTVHAAFKGEARSVPRPVWAALEGAQRLSEHVAIGRLYSDRLEEIELELMLMEALFDPRRMRPLSLRRYGDGSAEVPRPTTPLRMMSDHGSTMLEWDSDTLSETSSGTLTARALAEYILDTVAPDEEEACLPATAPVHQLSTERLMYAAIALASLVADVKVEPRLVAAAAAGERTVFLAEKFFGCREALRLAVHEVYGHLVAHANGRLQPTRLLEVGTAHSFRDQEGIAIWLEEQAGVLDATRIRTLAGRVVATDLMHAGTPFGTTTRTLHKEHGFTADDAVALALRAYRGGGLARDVGYLAGWLMVRDAIARGEVTRDAMRMGRVGLNVARELPALIDAGLATAPIYCPSFSYSRLAAASGTSSSTFPPSLAASLTRLELT